MPCFASAQPAIASCPTDSGVAYQRREPERTLLHRIVRENLASFLAEAAQRYPSGELPHFIACEFERYLRCGLLCTAWPASAVRPAATSCSLPSLAKTAACVHPVPPLVPDGVLFEDADGVMQFHALAPPTRNDLERLLLKIVPRQLRKLTEEPEFSADPQWMQLLVQALQSGAGRPVDDPPRGLCVLAEGFSLHAGVFVRELDGDALERLARYCAHPALALGRLSLSSDGQVLYRVKHAAPGAPRLLRLSPTEFLGRIAALVPPPRAHLVRFHGVFAPHSKHRARIVPAPPSSSEPVASVPSAPEHAPWLDPSQDVQHKPPPPGAPPPQRQVPPARCSHRLDWATRLRGTFAIDVLHCQRCGGRRRLCALITQENFTYASGRGATGRSPTQTAAPTSTTATASSSGSSQLYGGRCQR